MAALHPPPRERIAVEEGFTIPEIAAAARALAEKSGASTAITPARRALFQELADLGEQRIRAMDEDGITMQLVVIGSPGVQAFDPSEGTALARLANDRLAAACQAYPTRLAGHVRSRTGPRPR